MELESLIYEESESRAVQGNYRLIADRYLKKGYQKIKEDHGNWIVQKPAEAKGIFSSPTGERIECQIKNEICSFYGRKKISFELFERLKKDVKEEKVEVVCNGSNQIDIFTKPYYVKK